MVGTQPNIVDISRGDDRERGRGSDSAAVGVPGCVQSWAGSAEDVSGGVEPEDPFMRGAPVEMRTGSDSASGIGPARRLLTDTVVWWGCPSVDDIALVVSELITNAVEHTTGAATATITHERDGVVRVEVREVLTPSREFAVRLGPLPPAGTGCGSSPSSVRAGDGSRPTQASRCGHSWPADTDVLRTRPHPEAPDTPARQHCGPGGHCTVPRRRQPRQGGRQTGPRHRHLTSCIHPDGGHSQARVVAQREGSVFARRPPSPTSASRPHGDARGWTCFAYL